MLYGDRFIYTEIEQLLSGMCGVSCLYVDRLIWQPVAKQPQPSECQWEHVATFNAVGHVQAAKQQRKFSAGTLASPTWQAVTAWNTSTSIGNRRPYCLPSGTEEPDVKCVDCNAASDKSGVNCRYRRTSSCWTQTYNPGRTNTIRGSKHRSENYPPFKRSYKMKFLLAWRMKRELTTCTFVSKVYVGYSYGQKTWRGNCHQWLLWDYLNELHQIIHDFIKQLGFY